MLASEICQPSMELDPLRLLRLTQPDHASNNGVPPLLSAAILCGLTLLTWVLGEPAGIVIQSLLKSVFW